MGLTKIINLLFKPISLFFWYLQKFISRNEQIWLFGAGEGHKYADNAKWLYEYVLKNHEEIEAIWVTKSKEILYELKSDGKPVIFAYSIKGVMKSLQAGFVFLTNKPSDFNANTINGACQVWLWHGVMMKYIGLDSNYFSYAKSGLSGRIKRKLYKTLYPENTYQPDYVVNTSDFFTPYFSSAFGLNEDKVWVTGYPRNDVLFETKKDQFLEKLDKQFDQPFKILYMPTWRNKSHGDEFKPFGNYEFSLVNFQEYLQENNAVLLNKSHAFENESLFGEEASRIVDIDDSDVEDLYLFLKDIDLLITDFSSVYFDFLLTQKPVILAPFDFDKYVKNSRPLYYDYYEEILGVKANSWKEVLEVLKEKRFYSLDKKGQAKYHKYADGDSSHRIINKIMGLR